MTFQIPAQVEEKDIDPFNDVGLRKLIQNHAEAAYRLKEQQLGLDNVRQLERIILLSTIDQLWKDHLLAMDHLREGIGLQGYGQKDPLIEYKKQAFRYFEMMMNQITGDVIRKLFAVQVAPSELYEEEAEEYEEQEANIQYNLTADGELVPTSKPKAPEATPVRAPQPARMTMPNMRGPRQMTLGRGPMGTEAGATSGGAVPVSTGNVAKAGRNDPCPCGSGKKYKKCHGA